MRLISCADMPPVIGGMILRPIHRRLTRILSELAALQVVGYEIVEPLALSYQLRISVFH